MLGPLLALIVALAPAPAPQDPPAARARQILSAPHYQTELPGDAEARASREGGDRRLPTRSQRPQGDADGGSPGSSWSLPLPDGGIGFVFWILLGIAAVAALVVTLSAARGYHRDVEVRDEHAPPATATSPAAFAAPALDRVEELARDGRFGEAIRLLLQLTFGALRGAGAGADPSLTSREIAARLQLSAASRTSLRALVDAVERSLFGRREPSEESYAHCMREYEALLEANRSAP